MRVKIKNWDTFQHYSKRNPPWVKLHNSTMTGETWVMSSDKDRLIMLTALMVASRDDNHGEIPSEEYMQRVAYLSKKPDFQPLIDAGFFVASDAQADASTMQASASKKQADAIVSVSVSVSSYGEFGNVKLDDEQHAKMVALYGDKLDTAIDILDSYVEQSGKKYKSHPAVMKRNGWVWERVEEMGAKASVSKHATKANCDADGKPIPRY
jgi:hypothetical protein